MGKENFADIYNKAKEATASDVLSCRISGWSDSFQDDPNGMYAGIVIYSKHDGYEWQHVRDGKNGEKTNFKARSFYVIIQNTAKWTQEAIHSRVGEGRVHDHLYKTLCGEEFTQKTYCCGGFSMRCGVPNYSSAWLNCSERKDSLLQWKTDKSKYLSAGERAVVNFAIYSWITNGPNNTFQIGKDASCPVERAIYQAAAVENPAYAPTNDIQRTQQSSPDAQAEIDVLLADALAEFMPEGFYDVEHIQPAPAHDYAVHDTTTSSKETKVQHAQKRTATANTSPVPAVNIQVEVHDEVPRLKRGGGMMDLGCMPIGMRGKFKENILTPMSDFMKKKAGRT